MGESCWRWPSSAPSSRSAGLRPSTRSPRLAERTNRGKKVIRPIRRQRKIGSPAVGNEHYPGSGYHRAGNGQRRTMMSTLVLDGVSKIYGRGDTAVTALAEASLRVEAGELVALVGPS